ncbi:MAG TPA: endonuclease/exonuclease/phosphatase family protein [Gemmatimonadales bacterium]
MTARAPSPLPAFAGFNRLALGGAMLLGGCAAPMANLLNETGPRFEGQYAAPVARLAATDLPVRVVSFNIKFAREIDRAIEVLGSDSLRGADVLALQEMDERGVERIARTLGLNYSYYPASIHPASGKYFGPAVLSRWPIERSWKLLLPHEGWTRGQRRTATAAVVRVQGMPLLVYAVHLETPVQISDAERRDQALAVVADAEAHEGPVVIAGDFNSEGIGTVLEARGYTWQTRRVGPTVAWFSWDHIFTRGVSRFPGSSSGVVREIRDASDHHPVWAVLSAPVPEWLERQGCPRALARAGRTTADCPGDTPGGGS